MVDVTAAGVGALYMQNNDGPMSGGAVTELALAATYDGETRIEPAVTDETVWVQLAREGDIQAFDAIMQRYETRLLRFLTGLVGGDIEVARDLCQDTFLAAYQALPRMKGELRLSAWLYTIALNRARSHHRRWRFRKSLSLNDEILPSRDAHFQDSTATQEVVRKTLSQLPKQYAEVLLLQNIGGLSCREMSQALHCSEGAIKVRLMRAREAFKRIYERENGE